jgi:hypothetical protein
MPPTTGRIYDRNRLERLWATNHSLDNREESIYGLLSELQIQMVARFSSHS